MARQEDACWLCGTQWASELEPRTKLKVIAGGAEGEERWANEGGSYAAVT